MMASSQITDLYSIFTGTLSSDSDVRTQSESLLNSIKGQPSFAPSMLHLVSTGGDVAIKQAVAIYLKNFIEKEWETYDDEKLSIITESDKNELRSNIIACIVHITNRLIREQLLECFVRMIRSDFPKRWRNLLSDQIMPLLVSVDISHSSSSISPLGQKINEEAILELILVLVNWRGYEDKAISDYIHGPIFERLLMIANKSFEFQRYYLVKTVIKIFHATIQYKFISILLSGSTFVSWFNLILAILRLPITEESKDIDNFIPMKKWALHSNNRLFSRYGNPKLDTFKKDENIAFSKLYMNEISVAIVGVYLEIAPSLLNHHRLFSLACEFFEGAIRHQKTWNAMKDHVVGLIEHWLYPALCFNSEDQRLWEEDPQEFIRTKLDPFDDYYSPASAAINLIVDLIKNRKKACFIPILTLINQILSSPPDTSDSRRIDGALYMIGSLSTILMNSEIKNQMESFIATFVVPHLGSPKAHLRLRACWVIKEFDSINYHDSHLNTTLLKGILDCLDEKVKDDPRELPIRVIASSALKTLVDCDQIQEIIPPFLPKIIESLLLLNRNVELDQVGAVIQRLVELFSTEMAPYSIQLCQQLRDNLLRQLQVQLSNRLAEGTVGSGMGGGSSNHDDYYDDTDKMLSNVQQIDTITTLVEAMSTLNPESTNSNSNLNPSNSILPNGMGGQQLLSQLEEVLIPLIHFILSNKLIDIYEETFELIASLTFVRKEISSQMWSIFEPIYSCFIDVGGSYFQDMTSVFDNFISYGSMAITLNPNLLSMFLQIIQTVMTTNDYVESDWIQACKLIEALLLNCRGRLGHQHLALFIQLAMKHLLNSIEEELGFPTQVYLFEVVLNAIYYDPKMTLEILGPQQTMTILSFWNELHGRMTRVHDKRLQIVAIQTIISSQTLSMEHYPILMKIFMEAVTTFPKALQERNRQLKELEDGDENDSSSSSISESDTFSAEDEDVDEDGRRRGGKALKNVENLGMTGELMTNNSTINISGNIVNCQNDNRDNDEEDDESSNNESDEDYDYDDNDDELEEELILETPLDNVDIIATIREVLRGVDSQQQLSQVLSPEQIQYLQGIMTLTPSS